MTRSLPLLLLGLACSDPPPRITGLDPVTGPSGTALVVKGVGLGAGASAALGGRPLVDVVAVDAETLRGVVPEGLPPGPAALVVTDGRGTRAEEAFFFTVAAPAAEIADPCASDLQLFARVNAAGDAVEIDLRQAGKPLENLRLPVSGLVQVQVEDQPAAAGGCSSIWVVGQDGRRHLYDADPAVALEGLAEQLGAAAGQAAWCGRRPLIAPKTG